MIYQSKKDPWLVALISASILMPLSIGLYSLLAPNGDPQTGWSTLLVSGATMVLLFCLTYPLYYEITPTDLKIRCGMLIREQIPLSAIEEVRRTRNPLSAPAMSLDRLRVSYQQDGRRGCALISPQDRAGFMRELAESGVGLEVQGERVVRTR